MTKPIVLNLLESLIIRDLEDFPEIYVDTVIDEMYRADNDCQNVELLVRDLEGLKFRRHKFGLTVSDRNGRYVFRHIYPEDIPSDSPLGKMDLKQEVIIPVWVSTRDRLTPSYKPMKKRIKQNASTLVVSQAKASRIKDQ